MMSAPVESFEAKPAEGIAPPQPAGQRRIRRLLTKLVELVLVLLAVTLVVFVLTQVAPGNAARLRLGPRASQESVDALSHRLGLDRSLIHQYLDYLGRVLHGDLGTAVDGRPVTDIVAQGLGPTLWLMVSTMVVSLAGAAAIAWFTANRRDTPLDHAARLFLLLSLFLPSFWVGFLLLRFIAIPTGAFPVAGLGDGAADLLRSLVLPAITGAIGLAPILARSLRSSLVDVLDAEYVTVARSLGVRGPRFVLRHVLRNAAGPVVALVALNVGYLFFGVVVLESTFNIAGLGSALVTASTTQDVFVVQGITLLFGTGVVLANFLGEALSELLDPRTGES